jgi:hypothetical protein
MTKFGIDKIGNATGAALNVFTLKRAYENYEVAGGEDKQAEFDEMIRAAGAVIGPEVQLFMAFMEHAPVIAADAIYNVYKSEKTIRAINTALGACKCLYNSLKH